MIILYGPLNLNIKVLALVLRRPCEVPPSPKPVLEAVTSHLRSSHTAQLELTFKVVFALLPVD